MASLERSSPSMFRGQSWSVWADKVVKQRDGDAESDEKRDRTDEEMEPELVHEKEEPQVMRLKMEDSRLFGLCPARDEFYLVVCEQCGQVVKPQALQRHIEFRHGKPPDGPLPPLPIPAPLGDTPSPSCNKQIMRAHRKTDRTVARPPSRSNSHPHIVSYPQVADSPSPELHTPRSQRTQSVPDLIAADPSLDVSPMRQPEPHLRQPHSTSPPPPHEPHIPVRASSLASHHDVLSATPSPVNTVLLSSPSLRGVDSLSQQTTDLSQELSIQVSQEEEEALVNRTEPSIDTNYAACGDTVEVVLASPPVQTMPVPFTAAESLSTSISTSHIIPLAVGDSVPRVTLEKLSADQTGLVCISHSSAGYTPIQACPPVSSTPTNPTPTPPPAPSLSPAQAATPKSASKKKKANTVKSDKNVPCKDRRYDPDKHCGVWSDEHSRHCTRSLTCKTHSLSLRRAVTGRRLPFNELLAEHKARSQALAAAKAAAAAGGNPTSIATTTTVATSTTATTTTLSNNLGGGAGTQLSTSQSGAGSEGTTGSDALCPQKLGGTPTVPVLSSVGSASSVESSHSLKRSHTISTLPSSAHPVGEGSALSPVVVVPPDTSQNPAPLRRQEHHPSPTHQRGVSQGGDRKDGGERLDFPCTHQHPRPFAMCTYGSKRTERGMTVLSRKQDHLRAALAGLLERQLKPPPLKKMCYTQESAVLPNLARNGNATSVPPKLTNSHVDASVLHSVAPNAKSSKSSAASSKSKKSKGSKVEKGNEGHVLQTVKNAKVRRKSGSGGVTSVSPAIIQSSSASNIVHNILAVSSNSSVPLAIAPTTYTVVGGNGLQPVDVINMDPNTSVAEMQGHLLKNLRFVVTNIDTNANSVAGGGGGSVQPTIANVTLPIINAVGSTPVMIGNIGALQLQDRKMNVKSRTKSGSGGKGMERQTSRTRKASGGGLARTATQQTVQIGTVQGDTIIVQDQGVIPSMRSSPSPVLRPESSSPQLTSIPNGIIPSPSGGPLCAGAKVYSGGAAGTTVMGVGASGGMVVVDQHPAMQQQQPQQQQQQLSVLSQQQQQQLQSQHQHQQLPADMTSPSGTSTPSPGGNSTETSPSGNFHYTSGIQTHSANKSLSTSISSKSNSGSRKQQTVKGGGGLSAAVASHANQQTATMQQVPFQMPLQHIMANLIDAQGKPVSAIIPANPQLFSSIQLQQGGGGAQATGSTGAQLVPSAVATVTPGDHQNKAMSPPTAAGAASILAQQPIALSLQQAHHQPANQQIRVQGTGLAAVASVGEHTAQVVLSPSGTGDPRQELKLHH
ncbi:uncharacterized protein [Diadema setosum]|uniref:uncharacterized protein n=1 Tax=Diadema setosum TaxID=31175 RepID=UPI003B3B1326